MLTSFERNANADFRRERHEAALRAANAATFVRASRPIPAFGARHLMRMIGAGARKAVPFLFRKQGIAWRRPQKVLNR